MGPYCLRLLFTQCWHVERLVDLDRQLVETHLLEMTVGLPKCATFRVGGNDPLDNMQYVDCSFYINDTQYFDAVSEEVWNYTIDSFQPDQRWLIERAGRWVRLDDLKHYQRVIQSLTDAVRITGVIR